MFRKPRDQGSTTASLAFTASAGRPPTPPLSSKSNASSPPDTRLPIAVETPAHVKGTAPAMNGGNKQMSAQKAKPKGNGSILDFFKKSGPATEQEDDGLFLTDDAPTRGPSTSRLSRSPKSWVSTNFDGDALRFNESGASQKRRRRSLDGGAFDEAKESQLATQGNDSTSGQIPLRELDVTSHQKPRDGPLFESTLGEEPSEDGASSKDAAFSRPAIKPSMVPDILGRSNFCSPTKPEVPRLKQEQTSVSEDVFDGIEDFADDEFPEGGEEFTERLWLQEQRQLEREFEEDDDMSDGHNERKSIEVPTALESRHKDDSLSCPLCDSSLAGLSSEQASLHVNRCLDGDPLPVVRPNRESTTTIKAEVAPPHKRFQRAAIARPPQQSPFSLGANPSSSSAFSKIMSSKAEDAAWSTAAANEISSRGKAAYQRTCPFYKILPGLFICVDAFRYGAVQGCKAYFLSHFHSDHYIGLTSTWCHGPIYCSHVTANLVRQQLRVDSKWVVDLEFEQQAEVPETQGVKVTMIPANHCPGSSLFLFEKVVGRGANPKMQRLLHCGDFRACPAHVQHPLLRPDVLDAVSGKKRQQKLDVCYLDTTYLTPKYAFPSQEQVIRACADMCMSLSKDKVDERDDWEQAKKERAGNGMVKFVRTESTKQQLDEDNDAKAGVAQEGERRKGRGRLLVVCGTYSIGKERICLGIAKALNSKIFAPPNKQRICRALEDPELNARLTTNPLEAQVHMQMIMEIRAETLADYLTGYKPHFSRIVGFRPSGWNYRPPNSRFVESPSVQTVLHSENWKSKYSMAELVPQRGSTKEASCFGVPYSEHSSFRELTMFCCALRIDKIIPTVNVGSAKSREKMKVWMEKWAAEKKKSGLFRVADDMGEWS